MNPDHEPDGYLLHEVVCPCHHLTYNAHLGSCPITAADAPIEHRSKP